MKSPESTPATRQDGTLPKVCRKGMDKLKSGFLWAERTGRKFLARAYYGLPPFRDRDPRRSIVRFSEHCPAVSALPTGDRWQSESWYLRIRPAETVKRTPTIALDAADAARFQQGILHHQRTIDMHTAEVFVAGIPNAELFGSTALVRSPEGKIFIESALLSHDVIEETGVLDEVVRPKMRHMPGSYCLLASPWSSFAYYHWLMEALPRLSLIEEFEAFRGMRVIVPGDLKSYHRQTLALAGVSEDRWVKYDGGPWRVDSLVYPEVLGLYGSPSAELVAWLRKKFLKSKESQVSSHRRIYVSRRDAKRNVTNEAEITRLLATKGFEVVCPADFSVEEQVQIFSQAEIVVGPHGAGFTNMVFAPRGATLIEFFGDNYVNGCFWALANTCGHRHAVIMASTTTLDYKISLEKVAAMLELLKI